MIFRGPSYTDFYKTGHKPQYPDGTTEVSSNMTPRSNAHAKASGRFSMEDFVVFFGLNYTMKHLLVEQWDRGFFMRPKKEVIDEYDRMIKHTIGPKYVDSQHFKDLHDLGYLPIEIKALPEGSKVAIGVPLFTIKNTLPGYFWLTNFLETTLSAMMWKPVTSATMAYEYRAVFEHFAELTGADKGFIDFQGHDFSFRGMSNIQDAALSGAGHLLSFKGTDTIPAIHLAEDYYGANIEKELVGASVPATEHSVMCMGGEFDEFETFKTLINDKYPSGIISIVSDTWDFWEVVTGFLPRLKADIMARDGKVVIRPDSGDPVKIIVGDEDAEVGSSEHKGLIQCLWDIFGGTETDKKYKVLDSHIGAIYGDSITLKRAQDILAGLEKKGFASSNIVLGIGSYTYQHVTRDTHGFAIKSTSGVVDGERRAIFKDPKTDDGVKKSAKGLLMVDWDPSTGYMLVDQCTEEEEKKGHLQTVFLDGHIIKEDTFSEIRGRLQEERNPQRFAEVEA